MPGTEGSMLDMLSRLLDTKLDEKLNPMSTELRALREQVETVSGDLEMLGGKVEYLEVQAEGHGYQDLVGEYEHEEGLQDDRHADLLALAAPDGPTPQESVEPALPGHGYSLRTRPNKPSANGPYQR